MKRDLSKYNALVLNADFRPLYTAPLSTWNWEDSIKAVVADRVNVVAEYDIIIKSPSTEMFLPSVIALKEYQPPVDVITFTRYNLFHRDHFKCQYCGYYGNYSELTFDHVIPKVKGGPTNWQNIVTACQPCNSKKGSLSLKDSGLELRSEPKIPSPEQFRRLRYHGRYEDLHQTWIDYMFWDQELEML